jgi:hypothetical protein
LRKGCRSPSTPDTDPGARVLEFAPRDDAMPAHGAH